MRTTGQKTGIGPGRVGRLAGAAIIAVVLFGCRDQLVQPQQTHIQAAKPSCVGANPPHWKKCQSPPPPEDHLPPVASDAILNPLRLDASREGWLLATDSRASMVLRIDPMTGDPVEGFRARGKPLGVTLLEDHIYVGNADRGTIDVHRTNGGGFTASFGPGIVRYPADLAADAEEGLIFALDGERREVRVFTRWGNLAGTISGPGTEDGQLENPTGLGIDPVRKWVMVSDYGSADGGTATLEVFTYDGDPVHSVSGAGRCGSLGCSGGFSRPQSATVDAAGLVYLPDALLSEVLIYDPADWSRLSSLGGRDVLRVPTAVAFDEVGDLFVASSRAGEVYVLRGVGGGS